MGKHNSDTCTIRWEICCYKHQQSGCMLFVDMLCQAPAGRPICSGKDLRTQDTHTYIDR